MNPPSRAGGSNKFILRPVYSPLTPSLWTRAVAVAVAAASSSSSTTFLGEFSIESRKNRDEAKVPSSRGDDVLVFALACAASCVYVIAPPPPPPPPPPSPFRRSSSSEDPLAPPAKLSPPRVEYDANSGVDDAVCAYNRDCVFPLSRPKNRFRALGSGRSDPMTSDRSFDFTRRSKSLSAVNDGEWFTSISHGL